MKKLTMLLLLFAAIILGASQACAQEEAEDITPGTSIYGSGYDSFWFLTDDDMTGCWSGYTAAFTVDSPEPIGSLYLMFDYNYGTYSVTDPDTGTTAKIRKSYLHQYLDLTALLGYTPNKVALTFESGYVGLCELEVYGPGTPPAHVQQWQKPWEGNTDILLFSTHGDDEHLYFAGLLPLYAGQKKLNVQVVYMTDHRNTTFLRTHEILDGLWSVGVRAYPVFGWFADFISYDMEEAYETYYVDYETTWEEMEGFVVEQLRRFKPQVAVGHDIYGEYGHAMHKIYTDLLISAVPVIGDPDSFPDSAELWGTWELPKLYLHLYWGNTLVLDYDQPLSAFNGLTAFQVSQQLGYPCHKTQQFDQFVNWLYGPEGEITRADQIELYNPAKFGLYHTTVGKDETKNDLMENLISRAYIRRKAAAEVALLALEPPPAPETPVIPEEPVTEPASVGTGIPDSPSVETAPAAVPSAEAGPSHPLWIDLAANALILVAAITLLVVAFVKLKKRKQKTR